jgi:4-amino-4-deoxy-L-arabinose transferase-like glycosyltransferase
MQSLDLKYNAGFSESSQRQALQVVLLLVLAAIVFIAGISSLPLADPDEARYTTISMNMLERNNFLEPWLGDKYYPDKPPLYFWLTAGSLKILGTGNIHFAVRIVPVVGALLTILATYLIGATLFNHVLGLIGAGGLLTSLIMFGFSRFIRMDIYLAAFITLALWAFLKGYKTQEHSKWYLLMYPLLGLGVLTKGPIALIIPLAIIFLFLLWQILTKHNEWKVLMHMRLILGLSIVIAIAGPWFIYMMRLHKDYAREFFYLQNWGRAFDAANTLGHHATFLIYPAAVIIGFLPWTGLVILAIIRFTKSAFNRENNDWESRFLLLWFFLVLLFFSFSTTKLTNYILPAFMPGAVLLGRFIYDYWQSDFPRRRHQLTFAWAYPMVFGVSLTMALLFVASALLGIGLQFHGDWEMLPPFFGNSWWAGWGWFLCTLYRFTLAIAIIKLSWYFWRNWQLPQLAITITIAFLIWSIDLSYTDLPRIADRNSCMRLIPEIQKHADPFTLILAGPSPREQKWSLPFYLGGSYTVRFISSPAALADYYNNANQIIFLSTDENTTQQIKKIIGSRTQILARQKEMTLMKIDPAPRTLPLTLPTTLPAHGPATQPGTVKGH